MAVEIIREGDKSKQGNAKCPHCGEVVLIENHWGDPPKCGKCGVPYILIPRPTKYS